MVIVAIEIDAQKGFSELCPNELPVPGLISIVPELNYQASLANYRVKSKEAHSPTALWQVAEKENMMQVLPYPNANLTWVLHCVVGTEGFECLPGLPPTSNYDLVIYKGVENDMHPMGACYHDLEEKISTGLIEWLEAKEATTLLIGGLATDYCVRHTVLQLLAADKCWDIVLYLPACAGLDEVTVNSTLEELRRKGVLFADSRDTLQKLLYRKRILYRGKKKTTYNR